MSPCSERGHHASATIPAVPGAERRTRTRDRRGRGRCVAALAASPPAAPPARTRRRRCPATVSTDIDGQPATVDITVDTTQVESLQRDRRRVHRAPPRRHLRHHRRAVRRPAAERAPADGRRRRARPDQPADRGQHRRGRAGRSTSTTTPRPTAGTTSPPPSSTSGAWTTTASAGSGSLYGMGIGFTLTGVYYNKDLAAEAGIDDAAGHPGGVRGGPRDRQGDRHDPAAHLGQGRPRVLPLPGAAAGAGRPRTAVTEWVFDAPDATIDTPEAVAGRRDPAGLGRARATWRPTSRHVDADARRVAVRGGRGRLLPQRQLAGGAARRADGRRRRVLPVPAEPRATRTPRCRTRRTS